MDGGLDVINFGCRLNIAEGEAIRSAVEAVGARDTIIFNSCAVTDEAVRQARQAPASRPTARGGRRRIV